MCLCASTMTSSRAKVLSGQPHSDRKCRVVTLRTNAAGSRRRTSRSVCACGVDADACLCVTSLRQRRVTSSAVGLGFHVTRVKPHKRCSIGSTARCTSIRSKVSINLHQPHREFRIVTLKLFRKDIPHRNSSTSEQTISKCVHVIKDGGGS